MTTTIDVGCAACSAPLTAHAPGPVSCPTCDKSVVVMRHGLCREYGPLPRLDAAAAEVAFARLFEVDQEPEPGPPKTRAQLLFIPFYELSGTVVGVGADGRAVHRWTHAAIAAIEDHDELGLAGIEAVRAADEPEPNLHRPIRLQQLGALLGPERERDQVEAFLAEAARIPADGDRPQLLDRQLSLVYYPVWRLRYDVRGLVYQATIDALTGTVLHARVPARQRRRAFLTVSAAACLGYVLGTMARHRWLGIPGLVAAMERAGAFALLGTIAVAAVAAALYVLLLNATWNAVRYRNQLIYESGLKTRVLIHRPSATPLDQLTDLLKAVWQRWFAPRRYDRKTLPR